MKSDSTTVCAIIVLLSVLANFPSTPVHAQQSNSDTRFVVWAGPEVLQNVPHSINAQLCTDFPATPFPPENKFAFVNWTFQTIMPDGMLQNDRIPASYDTPPPRCISAESYAPTTLTGEYTVSSNVTWISNGKTYNATANSFTYLVKEGRFQYGDFSRIASSAVVHDWTRDGEFVLTSDSHLFSSFTLMKPDGEIATRIHLNGTINYIETAYVSPSGSTIVFKGFLLLNATSYETHPGFLVIDTQNATNGQDGFVNSVALELHPMENGNSLDLKEYSLAGWINDNEVLFMGPIALTYSDSPETALQLINIDVKSGAVTNRLRTDLNVEKDHAFFSPKVTLDGSKVLFMESVFSEDGHGYRSPAINFLILDVKSNIVSSVNLPEPLSRYLGCPSRAEWAGPTNTLIAITSSSCTRGNPQISYELVSSDGGYYENILTAFGSDLIFSPSGDSMIFCCGFLTAQSTERDGVYRLAFAHPMPEFGSHLAIAIVAMSIAASIFATKLKVNWRR